MHRQDELNQLLATPTRDANIPILAARQFLKKRGRAQKSGFEDKGMD